MMTKEWKDEFIPFTNDLMFALVTRDVEICRGLLERIIPDTKFGEIRLESSEHPLFSDEPLTVEQQKSLKLDLDAHGVRFDAYAKSEKMWAEIEMQAYTETHIGKRSRFYHANMDMDFLEAGQPYERLKPSYVIFICTYDYMGADEAVYYFQKFDVKNQLPFDDAQYTIVLNTKCTLEKVPEQLKPLFAYINDSSQVNGDPFIQSLHKRVERFNTSDWRRKQMTLQELMDRKYDRGKVEGRIEGESRVNRLNKLLIEAGRIDDLVKAADDMEFQEQLFKEFNL